MSRKAKDLPSKNCEKCGTTFSRRRYASGRLEDTHNWSIRKFCTPQCGYQVKSEKMQHIPTRRELNMIEDVNWIIGTDTPANIAVRVGYGNVNYLTRTLDDCKEHELANRLRREHNQIEAANVAASA